MSIPSVPPTHSSLNFEWLDITFFWSKGSVQSLDEEAQRVGWSRPIVVWQLGSRYFWTTWEHVGVPKAFIFSIASGAIGFWWQLQAQYIWECFGVERWKTMAPRWLHLMLACGFKPPRSNSQPLSHHLFPQPLSIRSNASPCQGKNLSYTDLLGWLAVALGSQDSLVSYFYTSWGMENYLHMFKEWNGYAQLD